jgi:hypothetical protein
MSHSKAGFPISLDRASDDLDIALGFVLRRIEEEAQRSGEPLTAEQRALLTSLPADSTLGAHLVGSETTLSLPRDLAFERLCTLAKAAHQQDLQLNPNDRNWKFAKAVTELHGHPISWLLGWSGVKSWKPWWDRILLVVAAIISISLGMFFMSVGTGTHMRFHWVIAATGGAAVVAAMRFGTRWLELSQLLRTIEKYRRS